MTNQTSSIIRTITSAAGAAALIITTTACGTATDTLTSVFQQASQSSTPVHAQPVWGTPQPDLPPAGWVVTEDEPTGFTIALPAAPKLGDQTFDDVRTRMYAAKGPHSRSSVVFTVQDLPPGTAGPDATETEAYLDDVLSSMNDSVSQVTGAQHLVVDGRPVLDGRLSSKIDGRPATLLFRAQIVGEHVVEVLSTGLQAEESGLNVQHQQALSTLHLPEPMETVEPIAVEPIAVPAGAGSASGASVGEGSFR